MRTANYIKWFLGYHPIHKECWFQYTFGHTWNFLIPCIFFLINSKLLLFLINTNFYLTVFFLQNLRKCKKSENLCTRTIGLWMLRIGSVCRVHCRLWAVNRSMYLLLGNSSWHQSKAAITHEAGIVTFIYLDLPDSLTQIGTKTLCLCCATVPFVINTTGGIACHFVWWCTASIVHCVQAGCGVHHWHT